MIKRVMDLFEERNNDDKEEFVSLGSAEANKVRMLGCWLGDTEDVKNRKLRAGKLGQNKTTTRKIEIIQTSTSSYS